ncbi:hypothetical protein [Cellulomonas edaphi]|uniref:TFIIS-type domain-containing protein n=1 Tax=Cellulomonas edaphi TaxID=3053468 RepID=A0ABT7S7Z4_9CELL|nr:hypothetical protein [Cellulomons edaphi]MDM7831740.1 hypothetical protein [Cellulomons edaphi]
MARKRGAGRPGQPVEPLGSLSQPAGPLVAGTEACLKCGATDLTRIRMTLTDGRPAVFVSCPSCEQTNWFALEGGGSPLDRSEVLGS